MDRRHVSASRALTPATSLCKRPSKLPTHASRDAMLRRELLRARPVRRPEGARNGQWPSADVRVDGHGFTPFAVRIGRQQPLEVLLRGSASSRRRGRRRPGPWPAARRNSGRRRRCRKARARRRVRGRPSRRMPVVGSEPPVSVTTFDVADRARTPSGQSPPVWPQMSVAFGCRFASATRSERRAIRRAGCRSTLNHVCWRIGAFSSVARAMIGSSPAPWRGGRPRA